MALQMPVYRELTTIESKVFMGMSWRQCLAAVILAVVCGGGYVGLWFGLGMDPNLAMYLIFPPGLPVAVWGWVRPKGLMPERYLKYILRHYTQREVYLLDGPGTAVPRRRETNDQGKVRNVRKEETPGRAGRRRCRSQGEGAEKEGDASAEGRQAAHRLRRDAAQRDRQPGRRTVERHHPLPGHQLPVEPGIPSDGDHRPVGQAHQQLRGRAKRADRLLHALTRRARDPRRRDDGRDR